MSTDVTVTVTVHDHPEPPPWARAVAVALTVLLVVWALGLIGWLVAAAALYVATSVGVSWYRQALAAQDIERQRFAEIAARADQQHQWVLAGDPRGTYGDKYRS
jgi:hypothetical protein